jgi:hypothetical protein
MEEDDFRDWEKYFTKEEIANKDALFKNMEPLKHYWYKAIKNSPLGGFLCKEDKPLLRKLASITMERKTDRDETTFDLKFFFKKNEFFTNDLLKLRIIDSSQTGCDIVNSDEIKWNQDKDLVNWFCNNLITETFFLLFVVLDPLNDKEEAKKIREK